MKLFGIEIRKSKPESTFTCDSDALLFGNFAANHSAMNLSTVFRCVDLISDSLAGLPIRVVKEDNGCKNELKNHSLNLVFSDGIANNLTPYHFMKMLIQSVLLKVMDSP